MTKEELNDIREAIDECINKEKNFAERYVFLNPSDRKHRYDIRDIAISAMLAVFYRIKERHPEAS